MPIVRLLIFCLALAGSSSVQAKNGPLVLAAASLQEPLTAAAHAWTKAGHAKPVLSFAASSALARQIESGAPADLFISADLEWMEHVAEKSLIRPKSRVSFVRNRLVLIAPASSRTKLTISSGFPLAQALGDERLAMADPDAVPAGKYGKAALTKLAIWDRVSSRIARAENVRAALALVERGEAPFGIVYATDAHASKRVRVVGVFPTDSHPPIIYPIARPANSVHPDAESFRRFLISARGKAIFRRFGFTPL